MPELEKEQHLQDGTILNNRYKILRFLSSGGFGNTYEAEDEEFGAHVAIKELFISGTCKRESDDRQVSISVADNRQLFRRHKEKFRNEAARLRKINHPNVVKVRDEFEENGTAYYVMDFVRGKSLDDMQRSGELNEKRSVQYINQVLAALEAVHDVGILHLDIKPSNVMVDDNNSVVLIDFGASKRLADDDGKSLSLSTGLAGTPGYAPLEQMSGDEKLIKEHSDIYAVGATLYKLVSGLTPPDSNGILNKGLPDIEASPLIKTAIKAAMEVKCANRPQTVAEFRAILNGGGSGGVTPPNPAPQPAPKPTPGGTISIEEARERARRRRRRMMLVGTLIGVFILAGVLTWLFMNGTPFGNNVNDSDTSIDSSEKIEQVIVDEPQQPVAEFEELEETLVVEVDSSFEESTSYNSPQETIIDIPAPSPSNVVDLGLSVLWCDHNVGADSPEGYGDYYTYDEAFSAARSMGSGWRLPTKAELEELNNKCIWSWIGSGYRVTGPNGNSIYLPAAGDVLDGTLLRVGRYGYYRGSSPYDDSYGVCGLDFDSSSHDVGWYATFGGFSVRPVRAK